MNNHWFYSSHLHTSFTKVLPLFSLHTPPPSPGSHSFGQWSSKTTECCTLSTLLYFLPIFIYVLFYFSFISFLLIFSFSLFVLCWNTLLYFSFVTPSFSGQRTMNSLQYVQLLGLALVCLEQTFTLFNDNDAFLSFFL